ncbi:hypothetical protein [Streptomyces triticiradicis]|nr:hypothetical protein [Streptomyces triticiradicis]
MSEIADFPRARYEPETDVDTSGAVARPFARRPDHHGEEGAP